MKKNLLFLLLLFAGLAAYPQKITYLQSTNGISLLDANGNPLPNAWAGGLLCPQVNKMDVNFDGIEDVVLYDRGGAKLLVFLCNKQNKLTYAPEYESFFPPIIRWMIITDYNHDGKKDIFTSASGGIGLYKNISTGNTLRFKKYVNGYGWDYLIYPTASAPDNNIYNSGADIPWIGDYDGDGDMDILSVDIFSNNVQFYRCMDYEKYKTDYARYDSLTYCLCDNCWGRFYEPSAGVFPILGLKNANDVCGNKYLSCKKKHGAFSLNCLDVDGDGDMDLIQGDLQNSGLVVMRNGKLKSKDADSITGYDSAYFSNSKRLNVPVFLQSYYTDVTGDSINDLVVTPQNYTASSSTHQVWVYENKGKNNSPDFKFKQDDYIQEGMLSAGVRNMPAFLDYDHDGDMDLVIATSGNQAVNPNTADHLVLYKNKGSQANPVFVKTDDDYMGISKRKWLQISVCFGDLNKDNKADMLIGDITGTISYYENISAGGKDTFKLVTASLDSIDVGNFSTPAIADIDKDGYNDLIIGCDLGNFFYYKNKGNSSPSFQKVTDTFGQVTSADFYYDYTYDGKGKIIDSALIPEYYGFSSPWIGDIDKDGKTDMISGSYRGRVLFFPDIESNISGKFTRQQSLVYNKLMGAYPNATYGMLTSPALYFSNKDSMPYLFLGNQRGGISLFKPTGYITAPLDKPEMPQEFLVYPNPVKDNLIIESNVETYVHISVYNMMGKEVFSANTHLNNGKEILPVSVLANGVYIISFNTQKGRCFKKFIKE